MHSNIKITSCINVNIFGLYGNVFLENKKFEVVEIVCPLLLRFVIHPKTCSNGWKFASLPYYYLNVH